MMPAHYRSPVFCSYLLSCIFQKDLLHVGIPSYQSSVRVHFLFLEVHPRALNVTKHSLANTLPTDAKVFSFM